MKEFWLGVFFAACLLGLIREVKAEQGDVWVDFSFRSYHFQRHTNHNENNLGLGLTYAIRNDTMIQGGTYANSTYHQSTYAGVKQILARHEEWNFGLMAGFVNGYYEQNRQMFNPYLLATIGYEGKKWGFDIGATYEVVAIAFKVKW